MFVDIYCIHIFEPSPNCCHKIGRIQLYRISLCALALQYIYPVMELWGPNLFHHANFKGRVEKLVWTVQSPHLYLIEHLWIELECFLCPRSLRLTSLMFLGLTEQIPTAMSQC